MPGYHDTHTMERMQEHLVRADGELEAAQHFLDPGSGEGAEADLVRAAVWWPLDNEALVPDRDANERLRNTAGAQHREFAFRLTRRGLDMLGEA